MTWTEDWETEIEKQKHDHDETTVPLNLPQVTSYYGAHGVRPTLAHVRARNMRIALNYATQWAKSTHDTHQEHMSKGRKRTYLIAAPKSGFSACSLVFSVTSKEWWGPEIVESKHFPTRKRSDSEKAYYRLRSDIKITINKKNFIYPSEYFLQFCCVPSARHTSLVKCLLCASLLRMQCVLSE